MNHPLPLSAQTLQLLPKSAFEENLVLVWIRVEASRNGQKQFDNLLCRSVQDLHRRAPAYCSNHAVFIISGVNI